MLWKTRSKVTFLQNQQKFACFSIYIVKIDYFEPDICGIVEFFVVWMILAINFSI